MDQKYFSIVLLASLRNTYLLKFGCIWNTDPRQLCLPWFLGRLFFWGIIYTGKCNISFYTGKQYFHSEKYQRPCFRATPRSPPKQPMKGGIPNTLSQLVASRLEVPFSGIVALPYSDPSWSTDRQLCKCAYLSYHSAQCIVQKKLFS